MIDMELSGLLQAGDRRGAASVLVRAYAADVYACCRALLKDPSAAEDLSQEVFSRAIAGLEGFRQDASARTWLLRVARNCCFDYLTRLRRQPFDVGAEEPDPDAHADDAPPVWELLSRREDAEQALAALGETERAIVVLHFGHGVGYPELAAAFNLKEGALRMRVSRALGRMRDALAPTDASASEFADLDASESAVYAGPPRASRRRAAAPPPPGAPPPSPPSSAGAPPAPPRAKRLSWPWTKSPSAPAPAPLSVSAAGGASGMAGGPGFTANPLRVPFPVGLAARLAELAARA